MARVDVRALQRPFLPDTNAPRGVAPAAGGASFADALAEAMPTGGLRFSGHADARLASRGIALSEDQLSRLSEATDRAAEKGARDAFVLVDEMAFIVNVPNRTVVTAMGADAAEDRVFTQIDAAVIAPERRAAGA